MKRPSSLLWPTVLVLGWLLDLLFWKQAPGINFAIYAALCLVTGTALAHSIGARMHARAAWLLPFIALLAITTFIRAEPLTLGLAVLLTLFLMALFAVTYAGGRWLEYGLADYALRFLRLGWGVISKPLAFRAPPGRVDSGQKSAGPGLWQVVRGVLLALPVMLLFGLLLGSADLVFRSKLDSIFRLVNLERLPEYIFRLIYILAAAWALLGVVLHAAAQGHDDRLLAGSPPESARFLGLIESSIVLLGVVGLFAVFVAVQFSYFFGGAENIGLQGYTFADYARRGYGELIAVAVLSLILLLGLGAFTRRDSVRQQRLFSVMSILVVILVGVMLISAGMRLSLYEMAYGFTQLRTVGHVSLIWLGLLLAAAVVLEMIHRERLFAAALLMAALGFTLTLSALDVDAFIVRQNVDRAIRGQGLDVPHLVSLSTDSVPALVGLFEAQTTPSETRAALGAALACRLHGPRSRSSTDWRSFTVSRWRAEQALSAVRSGLQAYRLVQVDGLLQAVTLGGRSYGCAPHPD